MTEWFFNSPAYLELEARRLGGTPEVMYEHGGFCAGVVNRAIPGTRHRDGVSVYGAPSLAFGGMSAEEGEAAMRAAITGMAAERRLVSLFLRGGVGETFPQDSSETCCVEKLADSVVVPLNGTPDDVFNGFRKRHRGEIRRGEKYDFLRCDDVQGFHEVYTQTMERQHAKNEYFFSLRYFSDLIKIPGSKIYSVRENNQILASAFIVEQFPYLIYHLGGAASDALNKSPLRVLLAKISLEYVGKEFIGFSLGSGVGGKKDNLYQFKTGFSKEHKSVFCFKAILNRAAYNQLCDSSCLDLPLFDGFFPAYRNPKPSPEEVSR